MEEKDRIAESLGKVHIVRCKDHGRAGQAEQLEALDQIQFRPVIERQGGLVEQQDGGSMHEGLDEIEPAPHPK